MIALALRISVARSRIGWFGTRPLAVLSSRSHVGAGQEQLSLLSLTSAGAGSGCFPWAQPEPSSTWKRHPVRQVEVTPGQGGVGRAGAGALRGPVLGALFIGVNLDQCEKATSWFLFLAVPFKLNGLSNWLAVVSETLFFHLLLLHFVKCSLRLHQLPWGLRW